MHCMSFGIGLAIVVLGLAYCLYDPFPEDAVEPAVQNGMAVFFKLFLGFCKLEEFVGYQSAYNCTRGLMKYQVPTEKDSDKKLKVTDTEFDGVSVRIYTPAKVKTWMPGVIYIHGGGWVILNVEAYDNLTRSMAKSLKAVVVSIDYRLSPEHPYPIPLEDCVTAAKHFIDNAFHFQVDAARIAIVGDSAGGNLAMAVSARLAKEDSMDLPKLRLQGLIYPALQMFDFQLPGYLTYTKGPYILKTDDMIKFWVNYAFGGTVLMDELLINNHTSRKMKVKYSKYINRELLPQKYQDKYKDYTYNTEGDEQLAQRIKDKVLNKEISPLLLNDEELKRLPQTYLITCDYDVLRDEGLILAKRLQNLKVPYMHMHWEGVQHGFFARMGGLQRQQEAYNQFIRYFKENLAETDETSKTK